MPDEMKWPIIVAIVVLVPEVISIVATLLQRSRIGSPIPQELEGIYDEKDYAESNRYTKAKSTFGLIHDAFELTVFFAFWFLHGFPWLDNICAGFGHGQIVTGLIFVGITGLASTILGLPWSIYRTFVLEESFGFNKTTPCTFVKDRLKGLALSLVLGIPLLSLILWFFIATGSLGWLWVFLTTTTFQIVLLFLMPVLIMPLFMQMIPLPEGLALVTSEIEKEPGLSFLSTRVFYSHDSECNGKAAWLTRDRRFAGMSTGATLSISWSDAAGGDGAPGWTIAEGEPGNGGTVYAICSAMDMPQSGVDMTWKLCDAAIDAGKAGKTENGNGSQALLLKDGITSSCTDVGSLRSKLLTLADKLGYKGANIFVIDGSSRSAHSNAFCTGFGKFRRICLFDTLLPLMEEQEIIAVLGHEIGHDRLYHVHTRLVIAITYSFVMLYVMGQFLISPTIASAFFVSEPKVYLGMVFFSKVWSVIDFAVSIPMTILSRSNEFAADRYSVDADPSYAVSLGDGLKKLVKKSKANLTPHPFYAFLTYSHPPLDIRLQAIREYAQKVYG